MKSTVIFAALFCLLLSGCESPSSSLLGQEQRYISSYEGISLTLDIDWPTQDDPLSREVKSWIKESLPFKEELKKDTISSYGEEYERYISTFLDDAISPSLDIQVKEIRETKKYVTFTCRYDYYLGGSHGTHVFLGLTFRKSDGKRMENLLEEGDRLTGLLKRYIHPDEGIYWEEKVNPERISLPDCPPFLTEEGLCFCYQEYEIAPYMLGMTEFTVPYEDIKSLLSREVRNLLP